MILECTIVCECDKCGEEESFDMGDVGTMFNESDLRRVLKSSGWELACGFTGWQMMCDDCAGK